jgi:hypothetical protein
MVILTTDALELGNTVLRVSNIKDTSVDENTIPAGTGATIGFQGPLIAQDAEWKYNESKDDLFSDGWEQLSYNDSGGNWKTGQGVFRYPAAEAMPPGWAGGTTLAYASGASFITNYYFRKVINIPGAITGTITITNVIDDGAVFYLNGQILQRFRVPTGPTITTLAGGRDGDVDDGPLDIIELDGSELVAGDNIIAVSLHQGSGTSSDAVFGTEWVLDIPSEPREPPPLGPVPDPVIEMQGTQVVISWENGPGLTLEMASDLLGPWNPVPNQANPYVVTPNPINRIRFYRLVR